MNELLDTERVYVEELLCILEVRAPAPPRRVVSWPRHSPGLESTHLCVHGTGAPAAGALALGRVCGKRGQPCLTLPGWGAAAWGQQKGFWVRDCSGVGSGHRGADTETTHQDAHTGSVLFMEGAPEFKKVQRG